jgi:hypothetical protein
MAIEATMGMWRIVLQKYYDALKWCIIEIDLSRLKDHDAATMKFHHSWCFDSALRASSPAARNKIDE